MANSKRVWFEGFEYEIRNGRVYGASGLPQRNEPTRRGARFNDPVIDPQVEALVKEAASRRS